MVRGEARAVVGGKAWPEAILVGKLCPTSPCLAPRRLPNDGVDCSNCGHTEAVFFQAPMKGDEAMKLIFMCTSCSHRWVQ